MPEIEELVVTLVSEERGVPPASVALTGRISHDLGCDGDDAVDLFEKFRGQFGVDLTELKEHWDEHFIGESSGVSLGFLVIVGAGVIAGGLLHEAVRRIPEWASMIAMTASFGWMYYKTFGEPQEEKIPITVQDMVDAARAGKWVKVYAQPAAKLFRSLT